MGTPTSWLRVAWLPVGPWEPEPLTSTSGESSTTRPPTSRWPSKRSWKDANITMVCKPTKVGKTNGNEICLWMRENTSGSIWYRERWTTFRDWGNIEETIGIMTMD